MTDQPSLPDAPESKLESESTESSVKATSDAAREDKEERRRTWRHDPEVQERGLSWVELQYLAADETTIEDKHEAEVSSKNPWFQFRRLLFGGRVTDAKTATIQGKPSIKRYFYTWIQELPLFQIPKSADPNYHFVSEQQLVKVINHSPQDERERICREITRRVAILDTELMRLFREVDHESKLHQNRYRWYQIGYIVLAALATILGGVQALALTDSIDQVPLFALIETMVALAVTYLATISGREPPLSLWVTNRRRAEQMRREYFRFLLNVTPYNQVDEPFRRMRLAKRAADVNRDQYPDEPSSEPPKMGDAR